MVITDKLQAYIDGIELNFGAETKHIQAKGLTADQSTNIIERFHGSLKDRTKVMRGLKKHETARLLTEGWLVHYNFFRPHESLGDRTPAEKAGIKLPYKNWGDVVSGTKKQSQETREDKSSLKALLPRASPTKHTHKVKVKRHRLGKPADISIAGVRM